MEENIETACASRQIPGVVLLASDKTGSISCLDIRFLPHRNLEADIPNAGKFQYSRSFGVRSLRHPQEPLMHETPMWIASFTKLMTTIAVLQCVEEGKLSLDTDVTSILHEYKEAKILTGFDKSEEPILKDKGGPITVQLVNYLLLVRTLLTQVKTFAHTHFGIVIRLFPSPPPTMA